MQLRVRHRYEANAGYRRIVWREREKERMTQRQKERNTA